MSRAPLAMDDRVLADWVRRGRVRLLHADFTRQAAALRLQYSGRITVLRWIPLAQAVRHLPACDGGPRI